MFVSFAKKRIWAAKNARIVKVIIKEQNRGFAETALWFQDC
jgi:hypothetical protein